jgi:anti-sigma factor RsiW
MNHSEAIEQMAAEKYLLDELTPDLRDAFEEHMFDCPECAFDIRAASSFVHEAKEQLPELVEAKPVSLAETAGFDTKEPGEKGDKKRDWMGWLRPLFVSPLIAGPVFAALLVVVGYQNLITYPALRLAATEPRLMSSITLRAGTRGGSRTAVEAVSKQGVVLQVELPEQSAFSTYVVDLYDPEGKLAWTHNISAASSGADGDTLSLMIPGAGLRQGAYALVVSGVAAAGQRTEIERHIFDIHLTN